MGQATPVVVFSAGLLLTCAFSTAVASSFWSPKSAVVLALGASGLAMIPRLLSGPVRTATIAALGFLAVASLSTSLSDRPVLSVVGLYGWGTGLVFVFSLVGAWAVGVTAGESGKRSIELSVLVGAGVNVLAVLAGRWADIDAIRVAVGGRPAGLMGNPVHLASLLAGAIGILAWRFAHGSWKWVGGMAPLGFTLNLAGSRIALPIAVLAVLIVLRGAWRRAIVAVAVLAVAIVAASLFGTGLGGSQESASTARLAESSLVPVARLETWRLGARATLDRPLLGAGPGRFRTATSKYRTVRLAQAEGAENVFVDAHNILIEYAATTGLGGVALLLSFLVLALRATRPSGVRIAAVVMLLLHLAEQRSVATTPLAFLLLGAACAHDRIADRRAPGELLLRAALLPTAVVAAVLLLVGDFELRQAHLDLEDRDARIAERVLPPWPEPLQERSTIAVLAALDASRPGHFNAALALTRRASSRDPSDPTLHNDVGDFEYNWGDRDRSEAAYETALRTDPQSVRALAGLGRLALREGRAERAVAFLERAAAISSTPRVRTLLLEARRAAQPSG